jgi:hypothetical protein
MTEIKAIETYYNGYRFRSRLEARWAVFFDAMGIRYEYEYEGFELQIDPNEPPIRYLPDFWFPKYKLFGEVRLEHHTHLLDDFLYACVRLTEEFNTEIRKQNDYKE